MSGGRSRRRPAAQERGRPRVGISSCLLGERVRYDGAHKRDASLLAALAPRVQWVSVCPEVEAGLGIPRPPVRLVRSGARVRLRTTAGADHTAELRRQARRRIAALAALDLCGYVLKARSPSCGLAVAVHHPDGGAAGYRPGLFAAALRRAFPDLPIAEEADLGTERERADFLERVLAYRRLRSFFAGRWTVAGLRRFHRDHSAQLCARSPRAGTKLTELLAAPAPPDRERLARSYRRRFMRILGQTSCRR